MIRTRRIVLRFKSNRFARTLRERHDMSPFARGATVKHRPEQLQYGPRATHGGAAGETNCSNNDNHKGCSVRPGGSSLRIVVAGTRFVALARHASSGATL